MSKIQQLIREAKIVDIDPENLTCQLEYGDFRASEKSVEVPLPNIIGAGNGGIINILKPGTRVLVAFLGEHSRETVSIIGVLPSLSQKNSIDPNLGISSDLPVGSRKYKKGKEGEMIISSHSGPALHLKEDREMALADIFGMGLFFNFNDGSHSAEIISNNNIFVNSGGRGFWGEVRRTPKFMIIPDDQDLLNYNRKLLSLTSKKGFFSFYPAINSSNGKLFRNPAISEYRMIINEFSSDSQFSGFEDELLRYKNQIEQLLKNEGFSKNLDPTNLIGLSEKELIEIVAGNLIDINGIQLDLNYRYLVLADENRSLPKNDESFIDIVRKSRRGVGYHFQLNSKSFKSEDSGNKNNFVLDLDKEGVMKLHVPKSSKTGNVPFPTLVNYSSGSDSTVISSRPAAPSIKKYIPVTLRDESNNPVPNNLETDARNTGIRFANNDVNPYFYSDQDSEYVRINKTKHHNIYEVAERLIANKIRAINIPTTFVPVDSEGNKKILSPEFLGIGGRPFEVVAKEDVDEKFDFAYSTVVVSPDPPGVKTGGDTYVAGKIIGASDSADKPQSNYYKTKITDNKASLQDTSTSGQNSAGGVSANIDFEGSLEASIGSDDADGKSLVLDTAGSLVMWLGKDQNNRSLVFQSDGEVMFNVGGTYNGENTTSPTLNKGNFTLRVNVTDKGFYSSEIKEVDRLEASASTDYIISIGEHGIVISGGTKQPMLLRNRGSIMMESTEGEIILKSGADIRAVPFGREDMSVLKTLESRQR